MRVTCPFEETLSYARSRAGDRGKERKKESISEDKY